MRRWELDDKRQRDTRERFYLPLYKQIAFEERYTDLGKSACSMRLQKDGIDAVLQTGPYSSECVEEKTVFLEGDQPYRCIFLETESCTNPGHESPGWALYTEADKVHYGMVTANELAMFLYILQEFQKIRMWFRQMYERYPHSDVLQRRYRRHTMPTENRTSGLLVPITDIIQIARVELIYISLVPEWHYTHLQLPKGGSPLPDLLRRPSVNNIKQVKQSLEDVDKAERIEKQLKACQTYHEWHEGA
jgi:hypothetical protein